MYASWPLDRPVVTTVRRGRRAWRHLELRASNAPKIETVLWENTSGEQEQHTISRRYAICWTAERSNSRLTTINHSRYLVLCSATSQQPPRIDCTLNMCTEPDKYSKATRIRTADCGCGVVRLQCCRVV